MAILKEINKYGLSKINPEIDGEETLSPRNKETVFAIENIKVDRNQYSIFELKRKYDRTRRIYYNDAEYSKKDPRNQVILDSAFQREEVWNKRQQSELIESVLLGLPLPLMYFYEDKNANLIVVDGRQRLTAFFKYLDNDYKLTDLPILKHLSGKKFEELEPVLQSRLEDFQLMAQIIKPPTEDVVKFQIFDRVNRGGTPLNNQEMRNALYQGNASKLLKKLAESNEFLESTSNSINSKRMKDRYVILRAIAFYLYRKSALIEDEKPVEYKGGLDELLGKTMEFLNNQDKYYLNKLENKFLVSFSLSNEILGENAFRIIRTNKRKSPINMNVFEVWIYLMILLEGKDISHKILHERYNRLIRNDEFLESIASHRDSPGKVDIRYSIVEKVYKEVISVDK